MKKVYFNAFLLSCLMLVVTEVINAQQVGLPKVIVKSIPIELYGVDPTVGKDSSACASPVYMWCRMWSTDASTTRK